jgi:hypothetical protein
MHLHLSFKIENCNVGLVIFEYAQKNITFVVKICNTQYKSIKRTAACYYKPFFSLVSHAIFRFYCTNCKN